MTDAPNRTGLDQALVRLVAADLPVGLLFVEVDQFRAINEAEGRVAGDRTLAALSRVLRQQARKGDFVTRYAGEEFVLLLRDADHGLALALAEQIRRAVERLGQAPPLAPFTVSIGVAVRSAGSGESADEFLTRADLALYDAKHGSPRNSIVHAPGLAKARVERPESGVPVARGCVSAA